MDVPLVESSSLYTSVFLGPLKSTLSLCECGDLWASRTTMASGPPGTPHCLSLRVETPPLGPDAIVVLRRPEVSKTRRNAVRAGVFGVGGTDTVRVVRYQNGISGCSRAVVVRGRVVSFGF